MPTPKIIETNIYEMVGELIRRHSGGTMWSKTPSTTGYWWWREIDPIRLAHPALREPRIVLLKKGDDGELFEEGSVLRLAFMGGEWQKVRSPT